MTQPQNPRRCAASPPLPLPARLGSPAGYRHSRQDPSRRTFHEGADFVASVGTPILAVRPGHVHAVYGERARPTYGYGNFVVLYHPEDAVYSGYAHLSEVLVDQGAEIVAGTLIGAAGATTGGRFPGMGPHLHFATRRTLRNGDAPWPGEYPDPARASRFREVFVDPLEYLARFGIVTVRRELTIVSGSAADCGLGWPVRPTLASLAPARSSSPRRAS